MPILVVPTCTLERKRVVRMPAGARLQRRRAVSTIRANRIRRELTSPTSDSAEAPLITISISI
jgi:hypothetical protein